MNREQRRAAKFKRGQQWDRNAAADPLASMRQISICSPFPPEEVASESVSMRMAWHRLTHGDGTTPDMELIANCCNVALVHAERIDDLVVDLVMRADAAIKAMDARYMRTGRWGADAAALSDVPPMLDLYDQLLELGTPATMVGAFNESIKRMRKEAA